MTAPRLDLSPTPDGYVAVISCRKPDGATAWEAPPPEGDQDAWVHVEVLDGAVVATSFSCWQVRFDLKTGRELSRTFVK
jgi:hypothetical protein